MAFLMIRIFCFLSVLAITGCAQQNQLAPVVELKWHSLNTHQSSHKVQYGETLYAIAFRYDKDYRQLADYNHLERPYVLREGQVIHLNYLKPRPNRYRAPVKTATAAGTFHQEKNPTVHQEKKKAVKHETPPKRSSVTSKPSSVKSARWNWPAKGKVVNSFIPDKGKKGIDIAGNKGDVVRAASDGVVAYSGNGLSGYGNLIIIKHDGQFLTAYGNNLRNRVLEGQRVKAGQIIAEMGIVDRKFWGVHFEIRKTGQPVNPMHYLQ